GKHFLTLLQSLLPLTRRLNQCSAQALLKKSLNQLVQKLPYQVCALSYSKIGMSGSGTRSRPIVFGKPWFPKQKRIGIAQMFA
ncbi:MAG: hypothetical protein II379_03280, partial [Oscillospiraceae bacterium]|nr:hypothetical protein [Oscillospiraceae bacterium]